MAKDGATVLLLVEVGGVPTAIGEQTGLTNTSERNMIDASHKQKDHTKWVYGKQDDTLTLDALWVPDDVAMQALRDAQRNKTIITIRRSEDGVEVQETTALVSSIEDDWPDNDASTVSVELQINDFWQALP